jgi:hypothetical protein
MNIGLLHGKHALVKSEGMSMGMGMGAAVSVAGGEVM